MDIFFDAGGVGNPEVYITFFRAAFVTDYLEH